MKREPRVSFPSIDDIRGDEAAITGRLLPHVLQIAEDFARKKDLQQEVGDIRGEAVLKFILILRKCGDSANFLNILRPSLWRHLLDYKRDCMINSVDVWKATAKSKEIRDLADSTPPADLVDKLRDCCYDPTDRAVLEMTLRDKTRKEIAEYLTLTQREVREIALRILRSPALD